MRDHGARLAVVTGDRKFGHDAVDRDAPDAIAGRLAEPERTVTHRDRKRLAARRDAVPKLGDLSLWRDAADLAHLGLGEPDIAVGTEDHAVGACARRWQREFRDLALECDAADLVGGFL